MKDCTIPVEMLRTRYVCDILVSSYLVKYSLQGLTDLYLNYNAIFKVLRFVVFSASVPLLAVFIL